MESIFGLPAHPFFVHAPLVLIPLVSAGAIAVAVYPAWRRRFGLWLVGATGLMVIATFLAVSSGEAFDDLLKNTEPIEHHQQLAETSRLLVIGLFLGTLALVLIGSYRDRSTGAQGSPAWIPWLLVSIAAFTVFAAVSSTVWIIRTGHEGTRVVWRNVEIGGESTPVAGAAITPTPAAGSVGTPTPTAPATGRIGVTITDYSVSATSTVLKAGTLTFVVTNAENTTQHEFVVMKGKFAELPKASNGAVDETKLAAGEFIGRSPAINPRESTTAIYDLQPGNYVLLCNISAGPNSHARDGQRLDVTVE